MTPPALEIADVIRTAGAAFVERNRQWIRWRHVKVLLAIARCRTYERNISPIRSEISRFSRGTMSRSSS